MKAMEEAAGDKRTATTFGEPDGGAGDVGIGAILSAEAYGDWNTAAGEVERIAALAFSAE